MSKRVVQFAGSRYELGRRLGSGAFGDVYQAQKSKTLEERIATAAMFPLFMVITNRAVKMVRVVSGNVSSIETEFETLRSLSHENIIRLFEFGSFRDGLRGNYACFAMELCEGGTLNSMLEKKRASTTEKQKWCLQLATAIEYLHSKNIVHRDLKPDNILFSSSEDIKVADFGLARSFHAISVGGGDQAYLQYMSTLAGTKCFMAPEVFDGRYTKSADVFSLGLVLHIIWKESYIWLDSKRFYVALINDQPPGLVMRSRRRTVSLSSADQFVQAMTKYRSEDRPKMVDILPRMAAKYSS